MMGVIAQKEFAELRRDGRYRLAAGLILILLLASSLISWRNYLDLVAQAQEAAGNDYRRWSEQQPKNPHAAAHHGVYAFKTPRPLAIVDGGIEPYVGSSILNGAHLQGEMQYPPAQEMTALQRFGDLSPALVGQGLLPLLVILLSFAAFAGEREQGTLRQLLSQGVKSSDLFWGKALGVALALGVVLAPAALIGLTIAGALAPNPSRLDELMRAGLMALVYGLYLAAILFLSLGVSARCRTSRGALVVMLVFWGVTVFAVPRVLLDLGGWLFPAPVSLAYWKAFDADLKKAWTEGEERLKQKLFAEHKVDKVEDLPFDYTGLSLQIGEEGAAAVADRYTDRRFGVYDRQSRLLEQGALLSPVTAVSHLSMALSGADLGQHRDFIRQAEQYRREMNRRLNDYISRNQTKGPQGWDSSLIAGDQALWASIPPFVYEPMSWRTAIAAYPFAWGALALWGVGSLLFARRSVAKLSGV